MTPQEKRDVVIRLASIKAAVASISDFAEEAAKIANEVDAKGLAFSLHMLKEAINSYGKEMDRWATKMVSS